MSSDKTTSVGDKTKSVRDSDQTNVLQTSKDIPLTTPGFVYVIGKPNEGKTFFTMGVIEEAVKDKFSIHMIVNNRFPIEPAVAEQALKHKNYFIHPTPSLEPEHLNNLLKILKENEKPKLVIIDNFTYSLNLDVLDWFTYARKYNATVIFISHTIYANQKVSPRLREMVTTYVLFYIAEPKAFKKILEPDVWELYKNQVTSKSFKFLFYSLSKGEYTVGKLPQFKITIENEDQFKNLNPKFVKALKKINDLINPEDTYKDKKSKATPVASIDKPSDTMLIGSGKAKPAGSKAKPGVPIALGPTKRMSFEEMRKLTQGE